MSTYIEELFHYLEYFYEWEPIDPEMDIKSLVNREKTVIVTTDDPKEYLKKHSKSFEHDEEKKEAINILEIMDVLEILKKYNEKNEGGYVSIVLVSSESTSKKSIKKITVMNSMDMGSPFYILVAPFYMGDEI